MEKIKNILNNVIEKINNFIKAMLKISRTQMLEKENYYIYKMANRQIVDIYDGENVYNMGEIKEATFGVAGMEFPIGSFDIKGNNIVVNEEVTFTPNGEMYMRGKPICNNPQIKREIARQIQQNGDVTQPIRVDGDGNLIKTNPEIYRNESYDNEARKRTERVSEHYRNEEQQEKEQENMHEQVQEQGDEDYLH